MDSTAHVTDMKKFIGGELDELPKPLDILPYRINSIYYLLADYYFKNRDFSKTVKYYVLDLSNCPTRFDAWAGLALSKASIMETKLNACSPISTEEWIQQSEEVLRCFKQCFKIDSQILSVDDLTNCSNLNISFNKEFEIFVFVFLAVDRVRKLCIRVAFLLLSMSKTIQRHTFNGKVCISRSEKRGMSAKSP